MATHHVRWSSSSAQHRGLAGEGAGRHAPLEVGCLELSSFIPSEMGSVRLPFGMA
jgi:hypothetical protein